MLYKIKDFEQARVYANKVSKFKSDVDISRGRLVFDGKSIMAVIHMGVIAPFELEIHTSDEEERKRFYEEMEEFRHNVD